MFIDAFAIVAILTEGDDAGILIEQVDGYKKPIYSRLCFVSRSVQQTVHRKRQIGKEQP